MSTRDCYAPLSVLAGYSVNSVTGNGYWLSAFICCALVHLDTEAVVLAQNSQVTDAARLVQIPHGGDGPSKTRASINRFASVGLQTQHTHARQRRAVLSSAGAVTPQPASHDDRPTVAVPDTPVHLPHSERSRQSIRSSASWETVGGTRRRTPVRCSYDPWRTPQMLQHACVR